MVLRVDERVYMNAGGSVGVGWGALGGLGGCWDGGWRKVFFWKGRGGGLGNVQCGKSVKF